MRDRKKGRNKASRMNRNHQHHSCPRQSWVGGVWRRGVARGGVARGTGPIRSGGGAQALRHQPRRGGLGLVDAARGLRSQRRGLEEERRPEEEGRGGPRGRGKGGGCRTGPQAPVLAEGAAPWTSRPDCPEGAFLQSALRRGSPRVQLFQLRPAGTRSRGILRSPASKGKGAWDSGPENQQPTIFGHCCVLHTRQCEGRFRKLTPLSQSI